MNLLVLLLLAVVGLAIYGAFHLMKGTRQTMAKRRLERQQEEQDERDFWELDAKHKAVRAKFDPMNEWSQATSVPVAFVREIRALNLQYRQTLQRRNGWAAKDFDDSDR